MPGFSKSIQSRNQFVIRPIQQANPDTKVSIKRHRMKEKLDTVEQLKRVKQNPY